MCRDGTEFVIFCFSKREDASLAERQATTDASRWATEPLQFS